ncbi:MAG TPA: Fe-S protein assembly co-chaperone HscB [Terriglobales bacterium]|nr:Fe-S protein assembly co-chaperone HscB [Terriglobales bacterium]
MATQAEIGNEVRAGDHFSFFGLPRKLNIDAAALEKDFYRLSRKLHPDLYVNRSPSEQEQALEQSSRLNDAYRTLKDPISRTQYLLSLEGVQFEEQSKAATDAARRSGAEKKQVVPPDLLEEAFELNMQLQELKMIDEKDPEVIAQLQTAKQNFEQRLEGLGSELKKYWDEWDGVVESGDTAARIKIRDRMVDLLNRRSYIRNLVRDVNAALAE